ncbi:S-layer homology domain-containing protein [Paenibacillus rhizovicinus]|uniref:S-layer homology domain-containing protein n=1 Tax=Paenibacillus rhizovicinus TaxID=2704463 RepID=A0A6C0NVZ9_9BACL|nr:S-layer homology domain-containing protein [Paenibacillus rhizovicinus]QHW30328.1 S-layer homology domain-containing protein [Paenibacillus rhizovicinus]
MKKPLALVSVVLLLFVALAQSAWAFSDTKGHPNDAKITELQKLGVLSGTSTKSDTFDPNGKLTYAAGISMIVNGLGLNLDGINFFKEPKVTDSFPNMKDDAWYANAFIIAAMNGLEIPRETKANDEMTREQFAHHLMQALLKKGDYAFIDIYLTLKDEADVNPDYMGSVQRLLISGIAKLDDSQNFHPKAIITRGDAAGWLYDTIQFVNKNTPIEPPVDEQPFPLTDLNLKSNVINADVNEVTVTAQAPNPGYGMRISSISFDGEQAIIHVEPIYPDKDKQYAQVMTEVKAVTYVSSAFKPVLEQNGTNAGAGSTGSSGSAASGSTGIIGSDGDSQND